jgi:hypothetical protein
MKKNSGTLQFHYHQLLVSSFLIALRLCLSQFTLEIDFFRLAVIDRWRVVAGGRFIVRTAINSIAAMLIHYCSIRP